MTKVSIIVPFHNVGNYISKCLSTLIYQTLDDIEIICIDDSSDDDSLDIVKAYAQNDTRIKILHTPGFSGQSTARNIGLEIASGEYIGFVDADDWIELDMFEKMYNAAKNAGSDITMCKAQLYDDKEQTFYTDDYYSLKVLERFGCSCFSPSDTKDEILKINVVVWNKIYKKDFLQDINAKFQNGFIYEDLPFFFETYLKAKKINIVREDLYYYRQNRTFSTMQNSDKKVYDRIPMVERTYNILKQWEFFEGKKPEIINWIVDDIFHRYTLLEDKYYEDYYARMKEFFLKIELTQDDWENLKTSYCYDEFKNIRERSYLQFWNFLIEKYKSSNKRIKAAEHKCNLDVLAIKEYLEEYKKEAQQEKENIENWWKTFSEEERIREVKRRLDEQFEFLESKKNYEMKQLYEELNNKLLVQEKELKKWQAESLRQQKEHLTAEFEWKLKEQKQFYRDEIAKQKYYYENNFLLVKIILKLYKISFQIKNRIKKFLKKN